MLKIYLSKIQSQMNDSCKSDSSDAFSFYNEIE